MTIDKKKIQDIYIESDNGVNDGGHITLKLFNPPQIKVLSSTWYPKLFQDSKFTKKGDSVLEFYNILKGDPFNNLYSLRGYIAEKIVQDMLKTKYDRIETFTLGDDLQRYSPMKNPIYKYFRGLPDVIYHDKDDKKNIIEIKSKSLSKKDFVIDSPPDTEIMQGKMLAILEDLDEVTMTYVMFDDELERKMMMAVTSCTPYTNECAYEKFMTLKPDMKFRQTFDIHTKKHLVDRQVILNQMKHAYKFAEGFRQTMTIKIKDLSKEAFSLIFKLECELEEEQKLLRGK